MSTSDEDLVKRAQKGDVSALDELLNRYQNKAFAIAYQFSSGDREEAKDITQEAFLKVVRGIKKFKGGSSFFTWFYRIIVNTCLDWGRKRQRWKRIFYRNQAEGDPYENDKPTLEEKSEAGVASNPVAILKNKQLMEDILAALKTLPEKQRMVFQLKAMNGLSIREISQIMGSAEGTVKSHLFRATHFLREALADWARP